jgi:TRAP-type uncharacterized transport system substrate-binding protein
MFDLQIDKKKKQMQLGVLTKNYLRINEIKAEFKNKLQEQCIYNAKKQSAMCKLDLSDSRVEFFSYSSLIFFFKFSFSLCSSSFSFKLTKHVYTLEEQLASLKNETESTDEESTSSETTVVPQVPTLNSL